MNEDGSSGHCVDGDVGAPTYAHSPTIIQPRNLLIVSDIKASRKLYSYAMDMKITRDAPIADKVTFKHLGIADTHTAQIAVREPSKMLYGVDRDRALVALLKVDNPPLAKTKRASNLVVGDVVLALRTDDIETVIKRLKEIGATFAAELVSTPDGVRMQINQYKDRVTVPKPSKKSNQLINHLAGVH